MIHPSENIIQQYVLEPSACSRAITDHIESCVECMSEVKNYQAVFSEIHQLPAPAFDFDLAALVMPQLPKSPPAFQIDRFIAGFLVIFSAGCISIPLYFFRKNILNMFIGIPVFFIYAIVISTSLFLIASLYSMYKKYQNQIRFLNIN